MTYIVEKLLEKLQRGVVHGSENIDTSLTKKGIEITACRFAKKGNGNSGLGEECFMFNEKREAVMIFKQTP